MALQVQGLGEEVHFPRTRDGWRLALHRYPARGADTPLPVILCGGYACNRYFVDFDDRYSLARFLARSGFDAWVVELRGRGLSRPSTGCRRPRTWNFDNLVEFDVPAAIAHVARATGRTPAWIGHSMGGMLLYAYLGRDGAEVPAVAAGVTIASPVLLAQGSERWRRLARMLLALPFPETVHQRWLLQAMWHALSHSSVLSVGMNLENIDHEVVGSALRLSLCNIPSAKLKQFSRWSVEGRFHSADGRVDYLAGLGKVTTRLLVIAGSADKVAPPNTVSAVLPHLRSAPVTYLEFGRAHGYSADYGHVDLIFGRAAPTEVFPAIAGWLEGSGALACRENAAAAV